jgi:hypothetical protein
VTDRNPLEGEVLSGGIMISPAVAADIVGALNRLEDLVSPVLLNQRLATLRWHLTRATTRVDASTRVVSEHGVPSLNPDAVADTAEVARMLNITPDAVRWQCRHGGLTGQRIGGRWMVALDSVRAHSASRADNEGGADV